MRDEAWASLKNLNKGSKHIVELAGEAEKLAKWLHPRDEEAAERHAIDAFLGALDRSLAAEVQKLGHRTMEEVVASARRIEQILEEQTDSKMERLVNTMQDHIRILKKDLKEAHEQIATHKTTATPVNALAAVPTLTVAAAQPPPPVPTLACHLYQEYPEEPPFYRPPHRQMDRRPPRCFLCGEEGHFVSNCPACPVLQRLLSQQERVSARGPPRGQILELPQPEDDSQTHPNVQLNC